MIFHGREKLSILNFWPNLKKQPYIFAFFPKMYQNFPFSEKFSQKVKNRVYNKKIHAKMTILQKSSKNQLFSLKIVLQLVNSPNFLKIRQIDDF